MKKRRLLVLLLATSIFGLSSCNDLFSDRNEQVGESSKTTDNDRTNTVSTEVNGNTTQVEIEEDSIESSFTLKDVDGNSIKPVSGVYSIDTAGEYTLKGKLEEGQIYVEAADKELTLNLEEVSISNSSVSPIFVKDSSEVTIKVKKGTNNYIYDLRNNDYSETDSDEIGTAAIFVGNGDLKINGKGTLSVTSVANSGIHGKDNVKIKNVTMLVKAVNNGIKGNDKVTIEENPTIGIVAGNNGIRTSNSELSSKGKQHGYIYLNGGTITINSYGDGVDAAYAVEIGSSTDDSGVTYTPTLDIYTNKYSSYTLAEVTGSTNTSTIKARGGFGGGDHGGPGFDGGGFGGGQSAEKADSSAKGIKANEAINVTAGKIFTYTYDDGLHANDDTLDSKVKASGNITISGGELSIKASDDGFHADGTLSVEGGTIVVGESHEGLEGNIVNISGGDTTVYANDDGVNASKQINVSGGRLDVTVSPNGDRDGIDSNGSITINGGTTISRGPNNQNASPFDASGTITIKGGTTILVGYGYGKINTSGVTKTTSSNGLSSGTHTVTIGSEIITYTNSEQYSGSTTVYGSGSATVK